MAKIEGYVIKVSYLHEAYISSFHICFYLIKKMLIAKEGKVKRVSILLILHLTFFKGRGKLYIEHYQKILKLTKIMYDYFRF